MKIEDELKIPGGTQGAREPAHPQQPKLPHLARLPFQLVLSVPFVTLILATVGLTGYLAFQNGQSAVAQLAGQLSGEIAQRIDQALDSYLATPYLINQLNLDNIGAGQLDLNDPIGLESQFRIESQHFDSVMSIAYADEEKEYMGVARVDASGIEDGDNRFIEISGEDTDYHFHEYKVDKRGRRIGPETVFLDVYDPRQRPWYQAAVQARRPAWTPIYLWSDGNVGLDAVAPVYAATGQLLGVLDTSLTLRGIGDFLQGLSVEKHGQTFIIERSGLLVASSTIKEPYLRTNAGLSRLSALQGSDPVVQATTRYLAGQYGNPISITAEHQFYYDLAGDSQFVQVTPYTDRYGLDWLIVVVIPASDFMAQIDANNRNAMLLILASLLASIILAALLARWITRPIVQLNQSARALTLGDWTQRVAINMIEEIGELGSSFNQMAEQLEGSFASLLQDNRARQKTEQQLLESEERLRRRLTELEAVNRLSTTLRSAQTLDEMLPKLLDETLDVLGADTGVIWLHDPVRNVLRRVVARGWFKNIENEDRKVGEGIAGHVFQTGQAHVSKEFVSDPLTHASALRTIPAGWGGVSVPIRAEHQMIGVLFASVPLPRELSVSEVHVLVTLAAIAGNAIHRARLHDQTERQMQRLSAMRAVDMAISSILDLRVILDILMNHISAQLKVDAADILLLDPSAQVLDYAVGHGFIGSEITRSRLRLGDGDVGRAALERAAIFIPQLSETHGRTHLLTTERFVSYYCLPLIAKGQVKGVLELFHRAALQPNDEWLEILDGLASQAAIAINNAELFEKLQRSNIDLSLAYNATIEGWSKALDLHDQETEGHTQRVTDMTLRFARMLGADAEELVNISRGALLHDIGKMGIPDAILHKPGPLSPEETEIMHRHPLYAYEMLSPITYLRPAMDIPYCHHEKWDGSGYPRGLKGEQIPMAARIFAIVDVWDALRSDRPYRKAWPVRKIRSYLRAQAGKHFDPAIVSAFLDRFMPAGTPLA